MRAEKVFISGATIRKINDQELLELILLEFKYLYFLQKEKLGQCIEIEDRLKAPIWYTSQLLSTMSKVILIIFEIEQKIKQEKTRREQERRVKRELTR